MRSRAASSAYGFLEPDAARSKAGRDPSEAKLPCGTVFWQNATDGSACRQKQESPPPRSRCPGVEPAVFLSPVSAVAVGSISRRHEIATTNRFRADRLGEGPSQHGCVRSLGRFPQRLQSQSASNRSANVRPCSIWPAVRRSPGRQGTRSGLRIVAEPPHCSRKLTGRSTAERGKILILSCG